MRNLLAKREFIIIGLFICLFAFGISFIMFKNYADAKNSDNTEKYFKSIMIQEGDTLWDIAYIYMDDNYDSIEDYIEEVKAINNIEEDYITAGCYLTIPYYEQVPNS